MKLKKAKVKNGKIQLTESQIVDQFFTEIKLKYPMSSKYIFRIEESATYNRGDFRKNTRPGIADVLFMMSNGQYGALWIEFKTKTGVQSAAQKSFEQDAIAGLHAYALVRSVDEAMEVIKEYILGKEGIKAINNYILGVDL